MARKIKIILTFLIGCGFALGPSRLNAVLGANQFSDSPPEEEITEQLAKAIKYNQVYKIDEAVTIRPTLINNRVTHAGSLMSLIHFAAQINNAKAARCLLAHGAKPDIFVAAAFGDLEEVRRFARADADSINKTYGNQTPLGIAIRHQHVAVVKCLLEEGATVEYRDDNGDLRSNLFAAAGQSSEDIFDLVIGKAKTLSPQGLIGTPVNLVALREDTSRLGKMIKGGADLNVGDFDGNTPLHQAALAGHTKAVELLLRAKCDHYLVNDYGLTPMQHSLTGFKPRENDDILDRIKMARLLIRYGAELDLYSAIAIGDLAKVREELKRDSWGILPIHPMGLPLKTRLLVYFHWSLANYPPMLDVLRYPSPLHLAARFDQAGIIELLIEQGCPVDACGGRSGLPETGLDGNDDRDNGTALHVAAEEGRLQAVVALLKAGADPDAQNYQKQTPLHLAAGRGHGAVVRLLIAAKCQLYLTDRNGDTPMWRAVLNGNLETVKILLRSKIPPDLPDKHGRTPLEQACARGDLNMFRLLCAAGADLHMVRRPYDINIYAYQAIVNDHPAIISYLVEQGVSIDFRLAKKNQSWTPLHLAAASDAVNAGEMLLKLGSKPNVTDDLGQTPLHVAAALGKDRFVIFLLLKGVRTDARDKNGKTPYDYARTGKKSSLGWLLRLFSILQCAKVVSGKTGCGVLG